MDIQKVAVLGAGTMGNGIAHVFAQNGFSVSLVDISEDALNQAMNTIESNLERMVNKEKISREKKTETLRNISLFTDLSAGAKDSDLVVEAATENLETKLHIFKDLDEITKANCILATNTSSISITQIAAATTKSDQVIGMHFMNPVPMMPLIEVIKGYSTSEATTNTVIALGKKLKKSTVVVNDYPGFVANRILMPMINEAIISLMEGVAGVEEIDQVMKLGMAHPMGPLELADFIGLDVCLAILKVLHDGIGNPKYAPCPLLINMVRAGNLGRKTGIGFYQYTKGSKDLMVSPRFVK